MDGRRSGSPSRPGPPERIRRTLCLGRNGPYVESVARKQFPVVSPLRPYLVLFLGVTFGPLGTAMVLGRAFRDFFVAVAWWVTLLAAVGGAVILAFLLLGRFPPFARFRCHFLGKHEVEVGRDGVLLSALHDRRFVPFHDIAHVTENGDAVVLGLRSGEEIALHVWSGSFEDAAQRRALAAIVSRGAGGAAPRDDDELARQLARNGRALDEWISFARSLGGEGEVYRTIAARRADLWRVVEDGAAPEDARVAAALALRVDADASDQVRLESVAADSASPRVRVGIERAEDEALAVAFAEPALTLARR